MSTWQALRAASENATAAYKAALVADNGPRASRRTLASYHAAKRAMVAADVAYGAAYSAALGASEPAALAHARASLDHAIATYRP